jgi:hypothetical protein
MRLFKKPRLQKWAIGIVLVSFVVVCALFSCWEIHHLYQFGHLAWYGLHLDVIKESASSGNGEVDHWYLMQVSNVSMFPVRLQACKSPSDVSPWEELIYRNQVERFDPISGQWQVTFRIQPDSCQPAPDYKLCWVRLLPGQSTMAVDYGSEVAVHTTTKKGDKIRYRVFCRFQDEDANRNQKILTSQPFVNEKQDVREITY